MLVPTVGPIGGNDLRPEIGGFFARSDWGPRRFSLSRHGEVGLGVNEEVTVPADVALARAQYTAVHCVQRIESKIGEERMLSHLSTVSWAHSQLRHGVCRDRDAGTVDDSESFTVDPCHTLERYASPHPCSARCCCRARKLVGGCVGRQLQDAGRDSPTERVVNAQ